MAMSGLYFGTPYQIASGAPPLSALAADLIPAVDNTYDIGNSTLQWKNLYLDATGDLIFGDRGSITAPADGIVLLLNTAGTGFTRLQFGGTTSSFPALKRSGVNVEARLADDSAYTMLNAEGWRNYSGSTAKVVSDSGASFAGIRLANDMVFSFSSSTNGGGGADVGFKRDSAGVIAATDGGTGTGTFKSNGGELREGRLSSTASIDLSSTAKQTLYTVPTGKSCIVTRVVVRSASAAITAATVTCGFNANADDVVAATALTGLTGSAVYQILTPMTNPAVGGAAAVFGLDTTVQEAAADTVTVDVYGFLF